MFGNTYWRLPLNRQEDVCFALWYPGTGARRTTALIAEPILPRDGERHVHWNASFEPQFLDRAIEFALAKGAGVALLHSHLGPGWQGMSADDIAAEQGNAGQVLAATGLPLVGLTIGTDGALSARFWIRAGARDYRREWCESVRVVGEPFQITFHEEQRREHLVRVEWLKTRPTENAVWQSGLFTNQVPACRLRDQETIEYLEEAFGLESAGADEVGATEPVAAEPL